MGGLFLASDSHKQAWYGGTKGWANEPDKSAYFLYYETSWGISNLIK